MVSMTAMWGSSRNLIKGRGMGGHSAWQRALPKDVWDF